VLPPSDSYTLRDLGNRLEQFLREEPHWSVPREELGLDMVRFEWAQVVAFDGRSKPPISPDDILDTPPSRLRLGLQPYLSPLDLDYAADDFLIAVRSSLLRRRQNAANGSVRQNTRRFTRPSIATTTCCTISAWTQKPSLSSRRSAVAVTVEDACAEAFYMT
jgi:hypothetical protein